MQARLFLPSPLLTLSQAGAGGTLRFGNENVKVSSAGIPTQSFNVIEQNMQLLLDGKINQNQLYKNIANANSFEYLHVYIENVFKANPKMLA